VKSERSLLVFQMLSFTLIGGMGTFMNFINLYLEQELGFTGSQIGIITMISMGLIIVVNPIFGYIGDKTGKHVLMLKIAFLSATFFIFLYSQVTTFAVVLAVAILFEISRACIAPFFDLITSNYCARVNFDFGKVRVFSSIGFMITVMSVGFIIAGLRIPLPGGSLIGFEGFLSIRAAVFGTIIIFLLLSFALMFFLPKQASQKQQSGVKDKFTSADILNLLKNKKYQFILVFIVLSLVALESAKSFMGNHLVVGLGSAENILSIMTFMMVFPEVILLPIGSKIIRRVGIKKWYLFSSLTMIIRMIVYSMTHNVFLFAVVSAVHGIGVMTHISGNIPFIRKIVEPKVLGLAFTVMVSVLAFSRAILSFVFGVLYETYDGFVVFRVATGLLILGFLWILRSKSLNEMERSDI